MLSVPTVTKEKAKEIARDRSPFITGTPITEPRDFFGRTKELKRLFGILKTHPLQNAAIIGQRRSGKTSLLNYLRKITTTPPEQLRPGQRSDWLPNAEQYRWIFVDFQDKRMRSPNLLMRYLLQAMQLPAPDEECSIESFMDTVSGNVQTPTVILMDEMGAALQEDADLNDDFWESLRALATNQVDGNLAFVLSSAEPPMELARHNGHSSPFFNIFGYTTQLGPLKDTEARTFIKHAHLPFSQDCIDWILKHSQRWPLLLQILCRERLFSLEEKDMSDEWQAEGQQQISPFAHLLDTP